MSAALTAVRSSPSTQRRTDSEGVELRSAGATDHLQDVEIRIIPHLAVDEAFCPLDDDLWTRRSDVTVSMRRASRRTGRTMRAGRFTPTASVEVEPAQGDGRRDAQHRLDSCTYRPR